MNKKFICQYLENPLVIEITDGDWKGTDFELKDGDPIHGRQHSGKDYVGRYAVWCEELSYLRVLKDDWAYDDKTSPLEAALLTRLQPNQYSEIDVYDLSGDLPGFVDSEILEMVDIYADGMEFNTFEEANKVICQTGGFWSITDSSSGEKRHFTDGIEVTGTDPSLGIWIRSNVYPPN